MFNQVIVGVDERDGGRDAIALAKTLVGQGGTLALTNVITSDPYLYPGVTATYAAAERARSLEELEERALPLLEDARGQAEAATTGIQTSLQCIESPSAGRGLHELAEARGADLIVLGSSRRGLLGRVLIGDDTRSALNGALCAVAIAPTGYSEHPVRMGKIGVGYNGSPESEHALEVARDLAAEHGAELSAFEAVSAPTAVDAGPRTLREAIDLVVERARERIARLGDVEPHAAYGAAADELAVYSRSLDLLVVGSRGYGPLGRLIHGSTSRELARTARCPLLVLTRARPGEPPRLAASL
jgi:nucleotide-binding universal stress UspA family protein